MRLSIWCKYSCYIDAYSVTCPALYNSYVFQCIINALEKGDGFEVYSSSVLGFRIYQSEQMTLF